MNTYKTTFFSRCLSNGVRVQYRLKIDTDNVISVEDIVAFVESLREGFHENIADKLQARYGGCQHLVADHHSVTIETYRG